MEPVPICVGCEREADEIEEYSPAFTGEDIDPSEYVRDQEGTYNRVNGHFMCTECYIAAGMPSTPGGWVAP